MIDKSKLDAAFSAEIARVSTLEYNAQEICRHFYAKLCERLATTASTEPAEPLHTVAWELHSPVGGELEGRESPEVRVVFSSRMADEYIEDGWVLERELKSDKRTAAYARGYDQPAKPSGVMRPFGAPASQHSAIIEAVADLTDEEIQSMCFRVVTSAFIAEDGDVDYLRYDAAVVRAVVTELASRFRVQGGNTNANNAPPATDLGGLTPHEFAGFDGEFRMYFRADEVRTLLATKAAPRPTDDELWDQTIRDRDTYHEWADKLAEAISKHFGAYIGEHSNTNCPWAEALEAIEGTPPAPSAKQEPLVIELGYGKIEVGQGHQGHDRLPAILFGRNGAGTVGVETEGDRIMKPGECIAAITFTNRASLEVVAKKIDELRARIWPESVEAPPASLAEQAGSSVSAGVAVPDALRAEIKKLTHYKHCMSYNDSYFTEPAGLLKRITYQLERLVDAAPVAQAVEQPQIANDDIPITMSTYGTREACEAEHARREALVPASPENDKELERLLFEFREAKFLSGHMDRITAHMTDWADRRTACVLREVVKACEAERVEATGTEGDQAYNLAIDHYIAAIRALSAAIESDAAASEGGAA